MLELQRKSKKVKSKQNKAITLPRTITLSRTIKAQNDLDYKALTSIFSLLFENSTVNYFPWFAIYLCIKRNKFKNYKAAYNRKNNK